MRHLAAARQGNHFVDTITGKRPVVLGRAEGLGSLAVEAAYESAGQARKVAVISRWVSNMKVLPLLRRSLGIDASEARDEKLALEKAIQWVKNNRLPGGGVRLHHKHPLAYKEVTGYLIPTLYNFGEKELAKDLARWEASVQWADGAITATDNVPYTFDTAQVIRGFLAVLDDMPELEDNLRRACDYVERHIAANGEVLTPSRDMLKLADGSMLSEYGNLYVLPPMLEAGQKLSEPRYVAACERGMSYFKQKADLVEFKSEPGTFSHYFGYMMEALVDLGEAELAKRGLEQAAAIQRNDGAIPAYPGAQWICATGMAQLALAWYKVGHSDPADKAFRYLVRIQNRRGGFYGGYGSGAKDYFPNEEISWAVKFFLDACYWKTRHVSANAWTSLNESANRPEQLAAKRAELQGFTGARR